MTRWIVGLAGVAATATGLAFGLGVWAAALFHEVDEFYRHSDGTTVYSDEINRYYATLQQSSYTMQAVCTPLLLGGMIAVLTLLALLAVRWERREVTR